MKVNEIFKSIEGEGLRMGLAAVFVRLQGCNLRCSYCDTMYAVEGDDYRQMNVDEVVAAVESYRAECGVDAVTLTGGEPMLHAEVDDLLRALSEKGFLVNVETNGTVPCKWRFLGLFYTMDWKCESSGMSAKMRMENLETLGAEDVLKFVVGSVEDLEETARVVRELHQRKTHGCVDGKTSNTMPHIFVSPVFGKLEYEKIVEWMLSEKVMVQNNARFQVQLHKVIWDPDMRGV
ncbi:MAG: radical SAM protein [Fibrobacter sp.]|uniref:radical SAM protein n=1 Tax=Fibrobacter sp. TaxID=35828 RepID=UPI002A917FB4|nr:radical SAM protein [Fibrobacter sp.]MDY6263301.1 radical SAM protein [Fibrobacter sp.]